MRDAGSGENPVTIRPGDGIGDFAERGDAAVSEGRMTGAGFPRCTKPIGCTN